MGVPAARVQEADAYVFSRAAYCWGGWIGRGWPSSPRVSTPSPPRNQALESPTVKAILRTAGILEDRAAKVAGPVAASVSDDPEADQVLQQVRRAGAALPRAARDRVHLACLPMEDLEENAAMVNAIQRRADVIVQRAWPRGSG